MGSDVKMEAEMRPKSGNAGSQQKLKEKVTESHLEPLEEAMQEHKRCWFNNRVGKIPW